MTPAPKTTALSRSLRPNAPRDGAVPDHSAQTAAEHVELETGNPPAVSGNAGLPVLPVTGRPALDPAGSARQAAALSAGPTPGLRGEAFLRRLAEAQAALRASLRGDRGRRGRAGGRTLGAQYGPGQNVTMPPERQGGDT
jgi:hypothetical protein